MNTIDDKALVEILTSIEKRGGTGAYVRAKILKATRTRQQLKIIWNSKQLSSNTKFKIRILTLKDLL